MTGQPIAIVQMVPSTEPHLIVERRVPNRRVPFSCSSGRLGNQPPKQHRPQVTNEPPFYSCANPKNEE